MSNSKAVAIAEVATLAILFPISIDEISFRGLLNSVLMNGAFLGCFLSRFLSFILFTAVNAVSADEKNADKTRNKKHVNNLRII